jgi:hypothetical protein
MATLRSTAALLLAFCASAAAAQSPRGLNFTGALSLDIPTGDLANAAKTGVGVLIRTERRSGSWAVRGGFTFDRFGGKGTIDNIQFFTTGGELVHYSGSRWYQYAGCAIYSSRTVQRQDVPPGTPPPANGNVNVNVRGFDFGYQAGVGVNYTIADTQTFVEFGFINVLTVGPSNTWFPVRFGIRL